MTEMTEPEVKRLLAAAMAYDNRKMPGQANVLAWLEAANRARWTFGEALEAVHQHYSQSTDFLMPGHVTAIVRAARRAPVSSARLLEPAKPAQPERVAALIDSLAARLGWRTRAVNPALEVECPACHSVPKRPCVRLRTRGHRAGEWQQLSTPHDSRVQAARDQTTEDWRG